MCDNHESWLFCIIVNLDMKRLKKIFKIASITLGVIILFYIVFLRYVLLNWGATDAEMKKYYPGDSIVADPGYINVLAVTVHKAPSDVWPWIAQMGLNKGGFYSYTWIENLFGCNLHNADRLHPEWQNAKQGDYEPVCATAEKNEIPGWVIHTLIPNRTFVYRKSTDSTWTMGFYIDSVSENSCRLITRMRYVTPKKFLPYVAEKVWFEWAHCIMQRGSITGIRKRAESWK
jgi:hypothetical protein